MESNNTTNISVFDRYYSDVSLYGRFAPQTGFIERINFPLWAIIGFPGSLFNIIVWSSRPMRRNGSAAAAIFQASLGVVDFVFFIINIPWQLHIAWHFKILDYPVVCETFPVLNYFIQYMSPSLALAFTLERYLAICHPFRSQQCIMRSSGTNALKFVVYLCIACFLTAGVQSLVFTYDSEICTTRLSIETVGTIANTLYTQWVIVTELLFFLCVPLTCLILNIFVIRVLKKSVKLKNRQTPFTRPNNANCKNQLDNRNNSLTESTNEIKAKACHEGKHSRSSTLTLLCTSFYMICAHLSVTVALTIYKLLPYGNKYLTDAEIEQDPVWKRHFQFFTIRILIDCFAMSHYAAKFPIYLITSKQFRKNYINIFCKCLVLKFNSNYSIYSYNNNNNMINNSNKMSLLPHDSSMYHNAMHQEINSDLESGTQQSNVLHSICTRITQGERHPSSSQRKRNSRAGSWHTSGRKKSRSKHSLGQIKTRPIAGLSRTVLNEHGERIQIR